MRYRALAATPIAGCLAVLVVGAVAPSDARWPIIDAMIRASKVFALFGCLLGGLSFRRADHLFRGWLLLAAMYALLVLRDGVIHRSVLIGFHTATARWLDAALVVPANALAVLGAWTMGRAWYVAGVALPGTRATGIPPDLLPELTCQRWPGNVRELRHRVEQLALLRSGEPAGEVAPRRSTYRAAKTAALDAFEVGFLNELMARAEGNVSEAARLAAMDRVHLSKLLRKHKLRGS